MVWGLMFEKLPGQDRQRAEASRVLCLYWMHPRPRDS